jgi:serine/threonine protein kinase
VILDVGVVLAGRYELRQLIGRGGMGEVYQGFDRDLERDVAIKSLLPHLARDPDLVARFRHEGRALARLRHPGIIALYDMLRVGDDGLYLVLEYVPGRPLDRALSAGPLGWGRVADIGVQVCAALTAAHAQGIVHRDIKPSNIFVSRYAVVKILDFGIAKANVAYRKRTKAATVKGTPPYMAPEQFSVDPTTGRIEIDQRLDIYAMGLVLYEMLTGTRAYDAPTLQDLAAKIRKGQLTPIRKLNKLVPRKLAQAVDLMRHVEKESRPATARDAIRLLKDACPEWLTGKDQLAALMEELSSSMGVVTAESQVALASTPAKDPKPSTAVGHRDPAPSRTPLVPPAKENGPMSAEGVRRVAHDAITQQQSLKDFQPAAEQSTAKVLVADLKPRGTPIPAGQRVPVDGNRPLRASSRKRGGPTALWLGLAGLSCAVALMLGVLIYRASRQSTAERPQARPPQAIAGAEAPDMTTVNDHPSPAESKIAPIATVAAETAGAKPSARPHYSQRSRVVANKEPDEPKSIENGTIVVGSSANPNLRLVVDRIAVGPPPKDYSVPPGEHLVEFFDVEAHHYLSSQHVRVPPGKRVVIRSP